MPWSLKYFQRSFGFAGWWYGDAGRSVNKESERARLKTMRSVGIVFELIKEHIATNVSRPLASAITEKFCALYCNRYPTSSKLQMTMVAAPARRSNPRQA